jgi:hypothetical protein
MASLGHLTHAKVALRSFDLVIVLKYTVHDTVCVVDDFLLRTRYCAVPHRAHPVDRTVCTAGESVKT